MKKTVLITGTSRGLGVALTEKYLEKGFNVFACARNIDNAKLLDLKKKNEDSLFLVEMDVSSTDSVNRAAAEIKSHTKYLDLIINNAATSDSEAAKVIEEMNVDNCLGVYSVNALGALRVAKAFIDYIGEGRLNVIANISSEAGSMTNCHREAGMDYAMSKAALNMGSVLLQRHLKSRGVKVLSIHPGWVQTRTTGPKADYEPEEAAQNLYTTIENFAGTTEGPVYINHDGVVMEY